MAKPHIHAASSARRFGGVPEDYVAIHEFLDLSKGAIADNRHRALTHTSWFISEVLPRVFGQTRKNSAGRVYSVRDVGEQHVLEDYGGRFIPTPQDFLQEMEFRDWMQNGAGGCPPSSARLETRRRRRVVELVAGATGPEEETHDEVPKADEARADVPGDHAGGAGAAEA